MAFCFLRKKKSKNKEKVNYDWSTEYSSPSFHLSKVQLSSLPQGGTKLKFSLSNSAPDSNKGYHWGVAEIQVLGGKKVLLGIPQGQIV